MPNDNGGGGGMTLFLRTAGQQQAERQQQDISFFFIQSSFFRGKKYQMVWLYRRRLISLVRVRTSSCAFHRCRRRPWAARRAVPPIKYRKATAEPAHLSPAKQRFTASAKAGNGQGWGRGDPAGWAHAGADSEAAPVRPAPPIPRQWRRSFPAQAQGAGHVVLHGIV